MSVFDFVKTAHFTIQTEQIDRKNGLTAAKPNRNKHRINKEFT